MTILFPIFGILIGIQFNSVKMIDDIPPYKNKIERQEVVELRNITQDKKEQIANLRQEINELEKEKVEDSVPLQTLKETVNKYELISGYSDVFGPGIVITIDSVSGENIAPTIEGRMYLLNLINELRVFGAEVISINDKRLVARSEITLAGNHININGQPVPPPYSVKAIGNINSFERYINHGTILFELMESDGIYSDIKFIEDIRIPALDREKPMEFSIIKSD